MKPGTFERFKNLLHQKNGIAPGLRKVSPVSARIARRIRTLGLAFHEDYFRRPATELSTRALEIERRGVYRKVAP